MSKLNFDLAIEDVEAAEEDRATLQLTPVTIAGEDYVCVRPAPGAFVEMMSLAGQVRAGVVELALGVLMFMNECFDEAALRAALAETGDYEPTEADHPNVQFNVEGERLARSSHHLSARIRSHDDDLGMVTMANVMYGLMEKWSGNPIGSPTGSTGGRSTTGAISTARTSRKASTSRVSQSKARRGSSQRST